MDRRSIAAALVSLSTALAALPAWAQSNGLLEYAPAAVQAVPLPSLILFPVGLLLALLGARKLGKSGARHRTGALLVLSGALLAATSGLHVTRAIALSPAIELTQASGGSVAVPEGSQDYRNASGIRLEILAVTPPETYCVSNQPANACVPGLELATGDTCRTSYTCTPPPVVSAVNDAVSVTNGGTGQANILLNDLGVAPLAAMSFGDSPANVGTFPADGVTVGVFPAPGGGTLDITLDAAGALTATANGTTGSGAITVFYDLQAGDSTHDTGQIGVTFGDTPAAADDTAATRGAGNAYTAAVGLTLSVPVGNGLLINDTLGTPAATLTTWGGGDASATVDVDAGASRPFAGGTLTVYANGSFDLVNPTVPGLYQFTYLLENGVGTSEAQVEIQVGSPA